MHVWNLWGSVPPTRLRTTDIETGGNKSVRYLKRMEMKA